MTFGLGVGESLLQGVTVLGGAQRKGHAGAIPRHDSHTPYPSKGRVGGGRVVCRVGGLLGRGVASGGPPTPHQGRVVLGEGPDKGREGGSCWGRDGVGETATARPGYGGMATARPGHGNGAAWAWRRHGLGPGRGYGTAEEGGKGRGRIGEEGHGAWGMGEEGKRGSKTRLSYTARVRGKKRGGG